MPKPSSRKSGHLESLENVFEVRTRRFSPFAVLGLRADEQPIATDALKNLDAPATPTGVPPTHTDVDTTPTEVGTTHTIVVVKNLNTTTTNPLSTPMGVPLTHIGVDTTHIDQNILWDDTKNPQDSLRVQDIVTANHFRSQLTQKARNVLAYLNSIRAAENPEFTVPLGYGRICNVAGLNMHYLRREVLPKLTMSGLIGIVHKSMEGTTYRLHYEPAFLRLVTGEENISTEILSVESSHMAEPQALPIRDGVPALPTWPSWIDRAYWAWLTPDHIQQLVTKAGSEPQAQEKLHIILYNENHGPDDRWVRDRRAVLLHYLRTPQADIWPNDDKYETLALKKAKEERDLALREKALAEETIRLRQETTQARFMASLTESQLAWLKSQAKRHVDNEPGSRFLESRYSLYKTEEERLIREWADRATYGETVPSVEDRKEDKKI